jgi:ABC-2 type transport system permease protein
MAVYERNYGKYQGELTPSWSRFLILPRYAAKDVFNSRLFTAFFVLCFLLPFVGLLAIYLKHNLAALQLSFLQEVANKLPIDASFFNKGIQFQCWLCFLMAFFAGPALVAPDLRNNGLALYLSRPFSRTEYVLGKMTVLVALMSLITWIPALLLFYFQGYLEGAGWLAANLRIAMALFVGSWTWILVVSLVTLAISAWVKWKPVARIALLVVFYVLLGFGKALNETLDVWWGWLLSLQVAMGEVWSSLFGQTETTDLHTQPVWAAWLTLVAGALLSLWLLARRIRAYEVVR